MFTSETRRQQDAHEVHVSTDDSSLIGQLVHVVLKVTTITVSLSKRRNIPEELSLQYRRNENLKSRNSNGI